MLWLLTHGQAAGAEADMAAIEQTVAREVGRPLPPVDPGQAIVIRPARFTG